MDNEFDERMAKAQFKRLLHQSASMIGPLKPKQADAIRKLFIADEEVEFFLVMRSKREPENISVSSHGEIHNLQMITQFGIDQVVGAFVCQQAQEATTQAHVKGQARN